MAEDRFGRRVEVADRGIGTCHDDAICGGGDDGGQAQARLAQDFGLTLRAADLGEEDDGRDGQGEDKRTGEPCETDQGARDRLAVRVGVGGKVRQGIQCDGAGDGADFGQVAGDVVKPGSEDGIGAVDQGDVAVEIVAQKGDPRRIVRPGKERGIDRTALDQPDAAVEDVEPAADVIEIGAARYVLRGGDGGLKAQHLDLGLHEDPLAVIGIGAFEGDEPVAHFDRKKGDGQHEGEAQKGRHAGPEPSSDRRDVQPCLPAGWW